MERFKSSVLLKSMAFLVQQICFVIMAITIFIGVTYWNYDDASFDIVEQTDFTKTNYYKRLVEDGVYDLITYVEYADKFQTDGKIDESRVVDVYDYVGNNRITGGTTISFGYTVEQLLEWQKQGFCYEIEAGQGLFLNDERLDDESYTLVEMYPNTLGVTLQEYAAARQLDYQEVCETLERAAEKATDEYEEYKGQVSLFKANNTNLRYAVFHKSAESFYTNMDVVNILEAVTQVQAMETYVTLDSTTADFTSNIFYANDSLNHYLNGLYVDNHSYIFAVGVDTEFPVLDIFHKEQLRYNNFEGWFQVLYKLFIASAIGYVITFFYLALAAGHRKGDEDIALTLIDRIKTEILLVLFLGVELAVAMVMEALVLDFTLVTMDIVTLVTVGMLALLAGVWFTVCYLSIARRLKAGTAWENSLIHMVGSTWRGIAGNKRLVIKVVVVYTLLFVVSVFVAVDSGKTLEVTMGYVIVVLLGCLVVRSDIERQRIVDGCRKIADGDMEFQIETEGFSTENKELGDEVNRIRDALHEAVEDSLKNERLKTNLITNVSHDIKTPLTSIINYVSLLKNISLEDETANQYIAILEDKSLRLKHLTEDLVEASKISSKNITLEKTRLNLVELIKQTSGEFYEQYQEKNLTLITALPEEEVVVEADGRRIWRVLENVYENAWKYSLEFSRVYARLVVAEEQAVFTLKNVSAQPLTVDTDELTKRFVRGDASRTTTGSGLGLSIAKDLTELHGGTFDVTTDEDLFCVTIRLPVAPEVEQ